MIDPYLQYYNTYQFIEHWHQACFHSDGCSSPRIAKALAYIFLTIFKRGRNYQCICLQHDFDYRVGFEYFLTRKQADEYLRDGIIASGNPFIARVVYRAVRMFGSMAWRGNWSCKKRAATKIKEYKQRVKGGYYG